MKLVNEFVKMFGCLKSVFRVSVPSAIRLGLVPSILLHSALQESVPYSAEGTPNILPFDVAKIQQIPDTCKYFPNFFHQNHHFFSTKTITYFASLFEALLEHFQALSRAFFRPISFCPIGGTRRYIYTYEAVRIYVWGCTYIRVRQYVYMYRAALSGGWNLV